MKQRDHEAEFARLERGSVSVVENFYGDSLDPAMIRRIGSTPIDQLLELAERVTARRLKIQRHLASDGMWSVWPESELGGEYIRPPIVYDDGALSEEPPLRRLAPADPRFADLGEFRAFQGRSLLLDEANYLVPKPTARVVDQPRLRHWVLYGDLVAVSDPLFSWADRLLERANLLGPDGLDEAEQQTAARKWANWIYPVLPLVNIGAIALVPDADSLRLSETNAEFPSAPLSARLRTFESLADISIGDAYLVSVMRRLGLLPDSRADDDDFLRDELVSDGRLVGQLAAVMKHAHPDLVQPLRYTVQADDEPPVEWQLALGTAELQERFDLQIATSSPLTRAHLLRTTESLMDGRSSGRIVQAEVQSATQFALPSMDGISIDDLVALRLDGDVFARVRDTFLELASAIEGGIVPDSMSLQSRVHEAAGDIVGPAYDALKREVRRSRAFARIVNWGTSAMLKLGIDGIAWLGGPAVAGSVARVSGPVSRLTGKKLEEKSLARGAGKDVAQRLLFSTLPSDRGVPEQNGW